ncbi:Cacna1h, partial [Symbiodinium pilosum]
LLKLCCLLFGGTSGNSFFCTEAPTLAHHKLRRDFPEPGDCVYAGRVDGQENGCDGATEGLFVTRPTETAGIFSVTAMFLFPQPRWKIAAWAWPHILRLAHLGEKCIKWLLNRPGIAELRELDAQHYIVLAVSCTKRGPPLLPANCANGDCVKDPTVIAIQAGEASGFSKWCRFEGLGKQKFNLAQYLRDFMACMGHKLATYSEMDGRPLVYYQCAVRRTDWERVREQFHE